MINLRVLHITPWFPNKNNPVEAVFIVEHLKSLSNHCYNEVLHISFGSKKIKRVDKVRNIKTNRIQLKYALDKWRLKEVLAKRVVAKFIKNNTNNFDIVNFHIAYPNAINIEKLSQHYPNLKFVITEHWTAYSNSFSLAKGSKGRGRIESIFNNKIPLFVVSTALGQDIQKFIGNAKKQFTIIPNVIDCENFKYKIKEESDEFVFCSINNWNSMKNPFVLIKAFHKLTRTHKNVKLVLGGTGNIIGEMKSLVSKMKLNSNITFTGRLSKKEVVDTLNDSNVYCQSSNYETFSVICAEALITGTPVIATEVGGMVDFVNEANGILVNDLEVESWFLALKKMYENYRQYDKKQISEDCRNKFNSKTVGQLYYSELIKIVNG